MSSSAVVPGARSIIYLGMDVHKDSITIAVLPTDAKVPTVLEQQPNDLPVLKKRLARRAREFGCSSTDTGAHSRPHEYRDMATPASRYSPSPREYSARPPVPGYPGHYLVKKVTTAGTFRLQQKLLYIANALVDQQIGLDETDDGIWSIYFNTALIATVNERDYIIRG